MTLPTVIDITPHPQAVTPDTFIDGLTSPARVDEVTRLDGHGRVPVVRAPVPANAQLASPLD
jgi:hypothetical protein